METNELHPIVLQDGCGDMADVLAGSGEMDSAYFPEVSCSGLGGAACKEGCLSGCKGTDKTGPACAQSCKPGCSEGCLNGCKGGNK